MKIAPQRVLDVGVGFGRWGMIVREFCDVWYGRVFEAEWNVHMEGIEAFEPNIAPYHSHFYNKIHIGDAGSILFELENHWDVIILGDVLEHFEAQIGKRILERCLQISSYVMINIPIGADWEQTDKYDNPYERHLSIWRHSDFEEYPLIRRKSFLDYSGRNFGVFLLSGQDPKNLKASLFSSTSLIETQSEGLSEQAADIFIESLQSKVDQLTYELREIKNSRGYQLVENLRGSRFSKYFVYLARLIIPGGKKPSNLDSSSSTTELRPESKKEIQNALIFQTEPNRSSPEELSWLEQYSKNRKPLSINNPDWRGILASAKQLFDDYLLITDDLDEKKAEYFANLIASAKPPSITVQGFPKTYYYLIEALQKYAPDIPLYAIYHGNYFHFREDYAWDSLKLIKNFMDERKIDRVGFVKQGMAEVMQKIGMPAHFIMNYVRSIPVGPSKTEEGCTNIAIFGGPDWDWKKQPYAMMAAMSLLPQYRVQVVNVSPRAEEFGEWFKFDAEYHTRTLSHSEVMSMLNRMHLNLNVTLTECAPMLPLESLSVGSPCLVGPTSHYFRDHSYLHDRLVVPYPDHAEAIAEKASQALVDRDQIVKAYQQYAPEYNKRAVQILSDFLEFPMSGA